MPSAPSATSPGELLALIRLNGGLTREELLRRTGMSRSTLYGRLERLERAGLLEESDRRPPKGGILATFCLLVSCDRVLLTIDLGHHRAAVSVCDVTGRRLTEVVVPRDYPDMAATVTRCAELGEQQLQALGAVRPLAVGLSVPAIVNTHTGQILASVSLVDTAFPFVEQLAHRFSTDVIVENDARALTLGAATEVPMLDDDGVFIGVKFSTGIGLGLITGGRIMRGSRGAAGDLGHLRVTPGQGPLCTCGLRGCLAAYVSGRAIIEDLGRPEIANVTALAALYDAGDPEVVDRVHAAALLLGVHLGGFVQVANPQYVAFGGILGERPTIADRVIASIQEQVSSRIGGMTQFRVVDGDHTTASGLVALAVEHALAPDRVNRLLKG